MMTANKKYMQYPKIRGNQQGSAIVIALMFLVLMTLVATNLSQTTNVELQIVRNDTEKRQQFYQAEAAAKEGAQTVENMDALTLSDVSVIEWINRVELDLDSIDLNDVNKVWAQSTVDLAPAAAKRIGYTVVDRTGPIDLSASTNNHEYAIMGAYHVEQGMKKGQVLVEIGYKRRF